MSSSPVREIFANPRKSKSSVWECFGFYRGANGLDMSKTICRICRRGVSYSGNTTNLHTHLTTHHNHSKGGLSSPPHSSMQVYPANTSLENLIGSVSGDTGRNEGERILGNQSQAVQTAVVEYLINDLLSPETVDSPAFRNIIKVFDSHYDLPNSEYYSTLLKQQYAQTKQNVAELLTRGNCEFLKVDIWKTADASYVSIFGQIMHHFWKMDSYALHTYRLSDQYSSTDVAGFIRNAISEWGVSENPAVVSGDVAEIKGAATSLNFLHMPCLSDAINMAATSCLNQPIVENLLKHVIKLVGYINDSSSRLAILAQKQTLLNIPESNVTADISQKSWESSYEMLDKTYEQMAAIFATFKDVAFDGDDSVELLSGSEQSLVQGLLTVLKPLKTAKSLLSDMSYPTAAIVLPILKKLEITLRSNECDSQVMVDTKNKVWLMLNEKFMTPKVREVLLICSSLDPRYKDLRFVEPAEREITKDILKEVGSKVKVPSDMPSVSAESYNATSPDFIIKMEPMDEVESDDLSGFIERQLQATTPSHNKKARNHSRQESPDKMVDWLSDVVREEVPAENSEDAVSHELARFSAEQQILSSASPLTWWMERVFIYPILSQIARKYMCTPAIVKVKGEAGETTRERQKLCLLQEHVEMMIFLNCNYMKFK